MHGAKVEKLGISSEYVSIWIGIQRNEDAMRLRLTEQNRMSKSFRLYLPAKDITLVLCIGLRSYNILLTIADRAFKDYCKDFFRGLATKHLN